MDGKMLDIKDNSFFASHIFAFLFSTYNQFTRETKQNQLRT
ncbi:hypothetical protein PLG01_00450 [Streptococcus mutans PKUSS-LG01]|nr:hypothetical protein PLG01_00450 [Streptococcus mutans PKUSS-LG01]